MRVTVLLFARLRELADTSEYACQMPAGATVSEVWQDAVARYPALEPFERVVSAAINEEFARPDVPVTDGDVIAFLPPVSGGADG